ncbi:hypothetical protein BDK51DRAFT_33819 [Blyttiomyces helicus]|uniref:PCFS4-like zinc finger domain-containing protein n=1 Tax=Blyttiomyces helicus TaxID=388810 RepID=A0A4P9WG20_9FUNG|nr:hypothetical protein BDK51DRAFT_33819 [Blyttiomyces helicus]|eukprot:RKO90288.1 hypothetical protein BDK51DRAFT_33819 [Blyttiomyces helicus]
MAPLVPLQPSAPFSLPAATNISALISSISPGLIDELKREAGGVGVGGVSYPSQSTGGIGDFLGTDDRRLNTPLAPITKLRRVRLTNEDINRPYPNAVESIYDELEIQCTQCGTRFFRTAEGEAKNSAHLDWHFRQNRRNKEKSKKAMSRDWFVGEEEWVKETEADASVRQAPTVFFEAERPSAKPEPEISNIPVDLDQNARCATCHEPLEKFFHETDEEWMYKGAVRIEGTLYHQSCYDSKSPAASASVATTASPLTPPKSETDLPTGTLADPTSPSSHLGKRKSSPSAESATTEPTLAASIPPAFPVITPSGIDFSSLANFTLSSDSAALLASLSALTGGAGAAGEESVKRLKVESG